MAIRIDTVTARNKLRPQRESYWHRLSKGFYVGFRKMSADTSGIWRVRYRDKKGKQVERGLGTLDEVQPGERFDRAVALAREWLASESTGAEGAPQHQSTVEEACNAYVQFIREQKGVKPAEDLASRYTRWILPDPICKIELSKLTREHLNAFRRRMVAVPVKINKAGDARQRSKDTVNRDMAPLRAALNHAHENGMVATDFSWRAPLKAFENVSKRRSLYLDILQRRELIRFAPPDLAAFLRGLSMIPLRPGALAALTVRDFDSRLSVLTIGKDKSGQDRKIKLPAETAVLFLEAARNRHETMPLLARSDSNAWNKDAWKGPIKDAVRRAGLPTETTAYTLRHSVISDLVHGGLDLLTVAQISGTSVAMIEKHYGHLRSEVAASAMSKLAI
ncbi:tyrosine-type recombinase/integrase [Massilia niabensis]|uniref:Tyrosine-type recombinase/integrase n=1 Tax=Massilia niabensis TaxID=544910 RepID=A0ABW0LBB9_9BURK